jgi:hypothetical protein
VVGDMKGGECRVNGWTVNACKAVY